MAGGVHNRKMHANRLAQEKSPYLLQHAHNPVDWFPWGPEAFEKAAREDKPVFLSIGYSTCHWCHVMERESFENERIASILNERFVPIKVDREERPDVDRVYMLYVQATTGGGGWPLSVWLTSDLTPFFGGTYFPPESDYGRPGFAEVLEQIDAAWVYDRDRLSASGFQVLKELRRQTEAAGSVAYLDSSVLESGFMAFRRSFDPKYGGFGDAPKFPRPSVYNFLFREYARTGNREALDMALQTLRAMAAGGIRDLVGGGFHRYSVDERWETPHYEKMLYDQAQLAVSYMEAFQITGETVFAEVARDTLDYVLRDMTDASGGFYSAEDADSAVDSAHPEVKTEGAFYHLSQTEMDALRAGMAVRETLLAARAARPRPDRDDKILTSWNGLMISAFAIGAQALEEPKYLAAARRAAEFLLSRMYDPSTGRLLHRYRNGEAAIPGFLDDYAFFVQGLLDLYEAGFESSHLEAAIRLTATQCELFEDKESGGFWATSDGEPNFLVLRLKDEYDGAEPSGNSVAALNLLRLAGITGDREYKNSAEKTLGAFARQLIEAPTSSPQMLVAVGFNLTQPKQITLEGDPAASDTRALLRALWRKFVPYKTVSLVKADSLKPATAVVCQGQTCSLPVSDMAGFVKLLE